MPLTLIESHPSGARVERVFQTREELAAHVAGLAEGVAYSVREEGDRDE